MFGTTRWCISSSKSWWRQQLRSESSHCFLPFSYRSCNVNSKRDVWSPIQLWGSSAWSLQGNDSRWWPPPVLGTEWSAREQVRFQVRTFLPVNRGFNLSVVTSGAIFMAVSYEKPLTGKSAGRHGWKQILMAFCRPAWYNPQRIQLGKVNNKSLSYTNFLTDRIRVKRDEVVGNITGNAIITSDLKNGSTFNGTTTANNYTYESEITYNALLQNTSLGINHNVTVGVGGIPAIDGLVAVVVVRITGAPKSYVFFFPISIVLLCNFHFLGSHGDLHRLVYGNYSHFSLLLLSPSYNQFPIVSCGFFFFRKYLTIYSLLPLRHPHVRF